MVLESLHFKACREHGTFIHMFFSAILLQVGTLASSGLIEFSSPPREWVMRSPPGDSRPIMIFESVKQSSIRGTFDEKWIRTHKPLTSLDAICKEVETKWNTFSGIGTYLVATRIPGSKVQGCEIRVQSKAGRNTVQYLFASPKQGKHSKDFAVLHVFSFVYPSKVETEALQLIQSFVSRLRMGRST